MTNDGDDIAGRIRRPLPVKSRSGLATAALTLGLTAIGAIGLPFAQYADAQAARMQGPGVVQIRFDEVSGAKLRLHVELRRGAAAPAVAPDCGAPEAEVCARPIVLRRGDALPWAAPESVADRAPSQRSL
ncbi:MAG: hypothetical protein VYD87_08410 [Pseudomonadota bacterium]|nr:hypothetical protein [Pseudomonadota bacterium]MEE3098456.1 hypothetical protein [Pseudomonadota bacterium]